MRSFKGQRKFIESHRMVDLTPYNISEGGFPFFTSYPILLTSNKGRRVVVTTTLMDTTYEIENPKSDIEAFRALEELNTKVCNNGGIFCLNWHNTSQYWGNWPLRKYCYRNVVNVLDT